MVKIKITQVRSLIRRPKDQKATMKALGLGKIGSTKIKDASPQVIGMVKKISHLVKVEEA